jgi:DNA invertase Pin-like site-specific DNA recombinase
MPELKVTPRHLERDAYLYIRQSTPRQVVENTESTQRQYAFEIGVWRWAGRSNVST